MPLGENLRQELKLNQNSSIDNMKRTFFAYLMANVTAALVSFLVIPLLSRFLGPEEFGKAFIFVTAVWLGNTILGLNLQAAATVRYKKVEKPDFAKMVSAGLVLVLALNVVFQIVLCFAGDLLSQLVSLDLSHIRIALIASFFNVVFLVWQSIQMIQKNVVHYSLQQIGNAVVIGVSTILLIVYLHMGLDGRIGALAFAHVVMGVVALFQMRNQGFLVRDFSMADFSDVLQFGLRLMPHMLGVFLFSGLDRLVVPHLLGMRQAGIYMGAANLAASFALLTAAFNRTVIPVLYEKIKADSVAAAIFLRRILIILVAAALPAFGLAWLILPPLVEWYLGPGFEGGGKLFAVLLLCELIFLIYTVGSNILMYFERNTDLSIITITTGIVFILTLFGTYRWAGLYSVVLSLLLAWILRSSATCIVAFRSLRSA